MRTANDFERPWFLFLAYSADSSFVVPPNPKLVRHSVWRINLRNHPHKSANKSMVFMTSPPDDNIQPRVRDEKLTADTLYRGQIRLWLTRRFQTPAAKSLCALSVRSPKDCALCGKKNTVLISCLSVSLKFVSAGIGVLPEGNEVDFALDDKTFDKARFTRKICRERIPGRNLCGLCALSGKKQC